MTTFFTSDEHYGHRNIIQYCNRPFRDIEHMTEELIARHNARVGPDDLVWHLGDFSMDERLVPGILKRLNGHHKLVAGNHDKCHPCHSKHVRHTREYLLWGFEAVHVQVVMADYLFCHMPYEQDQRHQASRYAEYCPQNEGAWLLHGHVHGAWKKRGREINVGVDVWDYAPVSFEEIERFKEEP